MGPPKLNLYNVEVRNFLYDYDSLVNIENDNYFVRNGWLFMQGNPEAGASVTIVDSTVKDSSFCVGMVSHQERRWDMEEAFESSEKGGFYSYMENTKRRSTTGQDNENRRRRLAASESESTATAATSDKEDDETMPQESELVSQRPTYRRQLEDVPEPVPDPSEQSLPGPKITLESSTFENLNYGQQIHALTSRTPQSSSVFSSDKGYILNLVGYPGSIEVSSNTIRNNHAFIPSAIFSNLLIEVPKRPETDEFDVNYLDVLEIEKKFVTTLSIEEMANLRR